MVKKEDKYYKEKKEEEGIEDEINVEIKKLKKDLEEKIIEMEGKKDEIMYDIDIDLKKVEKIVILLNLKKYEGVLGIEGMEEWMQRLTDCNI